MEFFSEFWYRKHHVLLREETQVTHTHPRPTVEQVRRCYIDNEDTTFDVEPLGPSDIARWEQAAREYIDLYLVSYRPEF